MDSKFKVLTGDNQPLPRHSDGTRCYHGLSKCPTDYTPCCGQMKQALFICWADGVRIEKLSGTKGWGVKLRDGSFMQIHYCPWCAQSLPL